MIFKRPNWALNPLPDEYKELSTKLINVHAELMTVLISSGLLCKAFEKAQKSTHESAIWWLKLLK